MPNDNHRPDVAVFIDFENVYVSVRDKLDANPNFEMIMDRCEDFGRVVIARAYADWYRYPRVTSALYANGIEPMYVPTYYYDREMGRTGRAIKNSVDMNLCIDAMKTLFTNTNIAKFVLATGDRDFIPLVNSIRQQGKEVIIIGVGGAASAHLAQSADEFIFYESLVGKQPTDLQPDLPKAKMPEKGRDSDYSDDDGERNRSRERERSPERTPAPERLAAPERAPAIEREPEPSSQPDIYDTLVKAINLARERGYVCSFGSLKLLMKELMGGEFKEGRYKDASGRPFAKFKDFVVEAERRGKVQVFTRGTVNEVFLPGEDPFKLSQFAQEITEEPNAPIMQVPDSEAQPETRPSVASNGRRRRRRSRGGQRGAGAVTQNGADTEAFEDEDELFEEASIDALPLPDLPPDESPEELFEELRERAEFEAEHISALATFDPAGEELIPAPEPPSESPPTEPVEELAPAEESVAEEPVTESELTLPSAAPTASLPFTDEEWQILRQAVGNFDRPVSFVQIHDALRNMRNSLGITRTNEELRSLIKQAINTGMLERLGKGNRANYRLAQTGQVEEITIPSGESGEQSTPVESLEHIGQPEGTDLPQPGAALFSEAAQAIAEAEASAEPATAASKPKRQRRKSAATPENSDVPAAPAARRSRKPAAEAQSTVTSEEPAAPKRSRRKKPATDE
jgi:uncharacterized protein (TIGR00288 family)